MAEGFLTIPIESLLAGMATLFSPLGMLMLVGGVLLGILIGATPGLSPSMGVALLVPFSYGMNPALAFILFVAVYQAANYGGSITAIALNAPGTPAAVVTAVDGYALAQRGKAAQAFAAAVSASALGGLLGAVILILFVIPIARLSLYFGPAEYCALAIFGLSTVVAFGGSNWRKLTLCVLLGLLLSTVGVDPFSGEERMIFGVFELYDGFSLIPVMIGLFALGEIFLQLEREARSAVLSYAGGAALSPLKNLWRFKRTFLRSSFIGTGIGIVPGAGATIASFISYGQAKRFSARPQDFGKGSEEGIIASEAANSSSVGGALIPLLSLGIPGSATDAVLLGALTLHGLTAGPELFQTSPGLVYGIFGSVLLANVLIFVFGSWGNALWLRVLRIPQAVLHPLIICLCIAGSFTIKNSLFDAWICVIFGIFGWALKRYGYTPAPIVLGFVLGEMVEMNFRRTLVAGGLMDFVQRPLSLAFLVLAVMSVLYAVVATRENRD